MRLIAERVRRQHRHDELVARLGIEDQVDDRVDGLAGVAAEGIMKQVIENATIELGLAPVVGHEPIGRAVALFPGTRRRVTHPQGQGAHRLDVARHLVRLAVEEDLQPVLDLTQEAVRVVHDVPFLGAQAADLLEPGDRLERGGVADLRILAAVQQLQELDDELDVANPALARS